MRVQPFPFGALPALTRVDLQARAALRSRLPEVSLSSVSAAAEQVLQIPLAWAPQSARSRPSLIGTPGDVGLLLRPAGGELDRCMLLELEGALAGSAVAAALRGRAPVVYDTTQVPSPRVIGAAAAVVQAIARRVLDAPLEILAAGPAHALAADLHRRAGALCTWPVTVTLNDTRYALRLTCLPHALTPLEQDQWRASLAPLEVPVVWARVELPRSQLTALEVGDALLLPELASDAAPRPVWLAAPAGEHAVRATLADGQLVYDGEAAQLSWSAEAAGAEPTDEDNPMSEAFQESLGDVPVVVRVEVGSVQIAAKRWGELIPGDTLTIGTRVGAPVTLRISGVEVAHGELVQVEGELGVRITKRLDLPGEPTQAR